MYRPVTVSSVACSFSFVWCSYDVYRFYRIIEPSHVSQLSPGSSSLPSKSSLSLSARGSHSLQWYLLVSCQRKWFPALYFRQKDRESLNKLPAGMTCVWETLCMRPLVKTLYHCMLLFLCVTEKKFLIIFPVFEVPSAAPQNVSLEVQNSKVSGSVCYTHSHRSALKIVWVFSPAVSFFLYPFTTVM